MNRRNWLKLTTSGITMPGFGVFALPRRLRIKLTPITDIERRVVARIVDLLIPSDETPGALHFGIEREVLAEIEGRRYDAQRVAEAALWLDASARADAVDEFVSLDEARQVALLARMESSAEADSPARAFRLLRHATMTAYYARPEVWPSLLYDGPPQPAGFPGYANRPRSHA